MSNVQDWANGSQSNPEMNRTASPVPQQQHPQMPRTALESQSQIHSQYPQQYQQQMAYAYPQAHIYQPQRSPVDIEKVKIWIQFGALMITFLLVGFIAGSTYTRANVVIEQSNGYTQQR